MCVRRDDGTVVKVITIHSHQLRPAYRSPTFPRLLVTAGLFRATTSVTDRNVYFLHGRLSAQEDAS